MWIDTLEAAPGTVTQVRASAQALIRFAKRPAPPSSWSATSPRTARSPGPRVVEHMVDAVLSFEGERGHQFRILRAVKNRFGPTDEIGVFEMTGAGLREVANPSALFLSERDAAAPGAAVFAGIEGTRPVLVEIQALVAPSTLGTPRRAVVGWDPAGWPWCWRCWRRAAACKLGRPRRLSERRRRPAHPRAGRRSRRRRGAGLVAANAPLPADAVYFGEIGLSGEVRPVAQAAARLKEAAKLGFGRAGCPIGRAARRRRRRAFPQ